MEKATNCGPEVQKIYGYIRVSHPNQLKGDGFRRQTAAIESYAAAHGLEVVQIFREKGVNGSLDLTKRPALAELLLRLKGSGVKIIAVERLNRLARDLVTQEILIADCTKRGASVISTQELDLGGDDPSRTLIRQIFGAIAQFDKATTVLRLKQAREHMRQDRGRCEGAKPFGVFPGEAEVIGRMRELRTAGKSGRAIAAVLDAEGRKPRAAGQWSFQVVLRILERGNYRAT